LTPDPGQKRADPGQKAALARRLRIAPKCRETVKIYLTNEQR